jgi:hypothetical protein
MLDHVKFQEECLRVFVKARDQTRKAILPIDPLDQLQVFLATQLDFYSQRCITVSHLLRSGLFWDAEIVFRAAIESAVKTLFVSAAPEPERSARVKEFRDHLSQLATFRFRARASAGKTLEVGPEAMFSKLAMSHEERDVHNKRWTKQKRKALEQKWAFSEMVKKIENESVGGHKLSYLSNLVHSYGVASHFLHADQLALDLSADREHRPPATKEILELLHFTEMLTRMVAVLISSATYTTYALGREIDLKECVHDLIPLTNRVKSLREDLYQAERHLYPASEV